jgi:hypothetical protein
VRKLGHHADLQGIMLSNASGQVGMCERVVGAVAPIEPTSNTHAESRTLLAAHGLEFPIDDSRVYDGRG